MLFTFDFTHRQAEDGSEAARLLIESMQVQCKIYEEWIEVMSDYSTVFSDDRRGVAEHYFNAAAEGADERAENGADSASNATVSACGLDCVFVYFLCDNDFFILSSHFPCPYHKNTVIA